MGLYNKIKGKIFPDEKDILYYSNEAEPQTTCNEIDNTQLSNSTSSFYSPTNFAQTRILSDKLKNGQVITIDVSNMDRKEALRMIDFLGGVMYALDGDMKKISRHIFEFSTINDAK